MEQAQADESHDVMELMQRMRDDWAHQIDTLEGDDRVERTRMRDQVSAWLHEYPQVDRRRQAAIEKSFESLMRRGQALPAAVAQRRGTGKARRKSPQPQGQAVTGTAAAKAPKSAPKATSKGSARAARTEGGATRPDAAPKEPRQEAGRFSDKAAAWRETGSRAAHTLWDRIREKAVWLYALSRLEVEHYVLLRKREIRQKEVGVRLWLLQEQGRLDEAGADAGVVQILRQVEQVDEAIRENRYRREALG